MTKKIRLLLMLLLLACFLAACIPAPNGGDDLRTEGIGTQTNSYQETSATAESSATSAATQAPTKAEATQPGDPYWGNEADDGQTKRY